MVAPGLMALMRTPLGPYTFARPTVASISAEFAAPPGRWIGVATLPPMPMMLTTAPVARAAMPAAPRPWRGCR